MLNAFLAPSPGLLAAVWFQGRGRWDQLMWPTWKQQRWGLEADILSNACFFFQPFHSSGFFLFLQMLSTCPLSFPSRPKLPVLCLDKADLLYKPLLVLYYFQDNFILSIYPQQVCPKAQWNPGEKKAVNQDVCLIQWQRSQIFFWLIYPTVDMA